MSSPGAVVSLVDCTKDAALQLWLMKPHVLAKPGARPDWFEKVLFAVDTNVVHDYLDPLQLLGTSGLRKSRLPIGRIFHFDDPTAVATLRTRIVDFTVEMLPGHIPLTFLPSLAGEMHDHLHRFNEAVLQGAADPSLGSFAEQAANVYRQLAEGVGGIANLAPILKLEEIEALMLRQREAEIDHLSYRLHRLVAEGRLTHFGSIADRDFRNALQPPMNAKAHDRYQQKLSEWNGRMKASRSSRALTRRYRNDIAALAQLEIANERLAGRCALIYLTTDSLVIEASEAYSLSQSDFGWASALDVDLEDPQANLTFGDLFVRHPNAYLEESVGAESIARLWSGTAAAGSATASEDLAHWLMVWVGRLTDGPRAADRKWFHQPTIGKLEGGRFVLSGAEHERYISALEHAAAVDLEEGPTRELQKAWETYVATAAEHPAHVMDRLQNWTPNAGADQQAAIDDLTHLKLSIEAELARSAQDSFSRLFRLTMQTRVALQISAPDQWAPEPLLIVLDERPAALDFIAKAETDWIGSRADRAVRNLADLIAQYEDSRKLVEEEERREEPGERAEGQCRYTYYLVHAFLLSQDRQWRTAEILADRALSSVGAAERELGRGESLDSRSSNGREAYIARGYCRRMFAQNSDQLELCRSDMHRARAILAAESNGPTVFDAVPERIEGELLMIDAMSFYFHISDVEYDAGHAAAAAALLATFGAFIDDLHRNRLDGLQAALASNNATIAERLCSRALCQTMERAAATYLALYLQFGDLEMFRTDQTVEHALKITDHVRCSQTESGVAEMTLAMQQFAQLLRDPPPTANWRARIAKPPLVEATFHQFRFDHRRFGAVRDRVILALSRGTSPTLTSI